MANSLTAYNPELWANESVAILLENLVAAQLVHTDFRNEVASYGDVVNTRKPGEFTAKRKVDTDDVTIQDATATNIQVELNQHWHTSFLIRDGEMSKSFKDLRAEYLEPAIWSIAQAVDKVVLGQYAQFLANTEGSQGAFSSTTAQQYIVDAHKRMNINKVPLGNRNFFLNPSLEAEMLKTDIFVSAEKLGDQGTALREASLGRRLGFNFFQVQNMASVTGQLDAAASTSLVDNASGYSAGATTIHIDTGGSNVSAGQWVVFGDDGTPQHITAVANLSTDDLDLTISPGLKRAVANDDTMKIYASGAVNQTSSPTGYAAGWAKEIVVDGFTGSAVEVGQIVTFGTTTTKYVVIDVTESSGNTVGITLDRPLEAAIADGLSVNTGPGGEYGLACDRPAIALISRPLAMPETNLANAAVANFGGLGLRVVQTYDGTKQGHLITVDLLGGIKVLDNSRGVVLIG